MKNIHHFTKDCVCNKGGKLCGNVDNSWIKTAKNDYLQPDIVAKY